MQPNTDQADAVSQMILVQGTIHNPNEHRHFMKLKPIARRVTISRDGVMLAQSDRAIRLIELGKDIYDPVVYLPKEDITVELVPSSRQTNCPLKGKASYFSLSDDENDLDIAWSYLEPFDFSAEIKGLVAFDASRVSVEEQPK